MKAITVLSTIVLTTVAQADELLAFGSDLYVEGPSALRDEVVARLRAAAGVGTGTSA